MIPILQEEPVYVFKGDLDIETLLAMRPGQVVYCSHPESVTQIRPARQWYEPIEDEL